MTATRHYATAVLPLPYAAVTGAPVFTDSFPTFFRPGSAPAGWTLNAPATIAVYVTTVEGTSRTLPVLVTTAAGGTISRAVTGLVAGRTYRAYVTATNVGSGPVTPTVYTGPPPTPSATALAVGDLRVTPSLDFIPGGPTATVFVGAGAAGRLALHQVQVFEVRPSVALDLDPTSAVVTLDESWTPYARATLVCPMPSADAIPKIDPRLPQRVSVTLRRDGAQPLAVADLTAMLAVVGAPVYNYATSPRANTWTASGGTPWSGQALTGPGINPPNGVSGGSRFVAQAAGTGDAFTVNQGAGVPAAAPATASVYARASRDLSVRVRVTVGAVTAFTDAVLRAGRWSRLVVLFTPAAATTAFVSVTTTTAAIPGQVLDLTQVQLEAGNVATTYFDGNIGRAGQPAGFPVWTGTAYASSSVKRYGAATAAALTTILAGQAAAYFSDLFADQYNETLDVALTQSRAFDLGLRARALDYVAATMTLELAGDEVLLQDYGRLNLTDTALVPPAGTSLKALTSWALNLIGTDLDPSSVDATVTAADVVWQVGTSLWDFLDPFVSAAGLVLWADERRRWYLLPAMTGAGGADNVTALTQLDDVLDRDDWADAVALEHDWSDPATGADTTTYAGQSVSTTAAYTKLRLFTKRSKSAASVAGAGALLARVRTLGRRVRVSAVCDYSVTPGHTAYLSTPVTVIDPCMTSAVVWELPGDVMALTTKDLP